MVIYKKMNKTELEEKVELLETLLEDTISENTALKEKLADANNIVAIATDKAPTKKVKRLVPEPFEIGGVIYQFRRPEFIFGAKTYIAAEELENEKLIKKLLHIGSKVIEVVSDSNQ